MDNGVGLRPTYGVGYKGQAKTGEEFEVIGYKGRKNITIRFSCGYERNTTSTHIKQGGVLYKKVLKCSVGDKFPTVQGEMCTATEVHSNTKVIVRFDNDQIKTYSYLDLTRGEATNTISHSDIPVGTEFKTNNYGLVNVVKYNNAHKVDVVFKDGSPTTVHATALRKGNVGHPTSGLLVGFKFVNSDGARGELLKYHTAHNTDVVWEDGTVTRGHAAQMVKNGTIYFPNAKTIVGVGYFGTGKYKPNKSGGNINYSPVVYQKWQQMITRCYSEEEQKKPSCKAYIDVDVCEDWHNFQNFALWAEDKLDKFVDGYELDKDMFGTGYLYCPENCTLLPDQVNGFYADRWSNKKSGLPEGVGLIKPKTKNSKTGYTARCTLNKVREYLGYYDDPSTAAEIYREAKEGEAKRLAEQYRNMLSESEHKKLINFTLESVHRK